MATVNDILPKAKTWLEKPYDKPTSKEVQKLIDAGGDELIDAFYQDLDFGTGGLRGIMGAGTNRVNKYTLGASTQGLAQYLKKQFPGEKIKVVIAYDNRHNSDIFCNRVAEVLASNDIEVYVFPELRPTPTLSFAIRHLNCHAGIMLTASHNPPEYNGYKVYWQDGGQLVPPHDKGVIEEVRKVKMEQVKFEANTDLIITIDERLDNAYLKSVTDQSLTNMGKEKLKIVFTSIHGTSITMLPAALEYGGFEKVYVVQEQAKPDGDFPTVKSPNPEEAEALTMALELARKKDADIVIGTDPDGDRVGIAVRNLEGELELLNGNQAASVLIYYLLEQWQANNKLDGNQMVCKTIVTTDLIAKIAEGYNVKCPEVLTGFKWIANLIKLNEGKLKFIGGGEESYGYLVGDAVRDKDAIVSGLMLAEAAAWAQAQKSSFFNLLLEVYQKYGFYKEKLISLTRKGFKGAEEIKEMMDDFRNKSPRTLGGETVTEVLDFEAQLRRETITGKEHGISLPKSNVVQFITDKGTKVTARPSGTEPKIKFYISVNAPLKNKADYQETNKELENRIASIQKELGV